MFGEQNVTTGASKLYIPAAAVPTLPLTESAISRTPLAVARLARPERQMIDVLVTHEEVSHDAPAAYADCQNQTGDAARGGALPTG